ncbi:MAG: hypothetical protein NT027_18920 [Proteobacteria bacterium]|nr:hypothetical protein [Pseudomonadota bacterium]
MRGYGIIIATLMGSCLVQNCKSVSNKSDSSLESTKFSSSLKTFDVSPGCKANQTKRLPAAPKDSLRIMAYNVQNLFDTTHDIENEIDKDDTEFLPKTAAISDRSVKSVKQACCNLKSDDIVIKALSKDLSQAEIAQMREDANDSEETHHSCKDKTKANSELISKLSQNVDKNELASIKESGAKAADRCNSFKDWNDEFLQGHLKGLKQAFDETHSELPGILVVTEMENYNSFNMLTNALGYTTGGAEPVRNISKFNRTELKSSVSGVKSFNCQANPKGFKNVWLTTSSDVRGVDVGLVFRENADVEFVACREHEVDVGFPTRNILEVELTYGGHPLFVFGNHWPSQRGGRDAGPRVAAAKALRTLMEQRSKLANASVLATGDFNTVAADKPHPYTTELLAKNRKIQFFDLEEESGTKSAGSFYFPPKGQWSHFDKFFYNDNLKGAGPLQLDSKSYFVHNNAAMSEESVITAYRDFDDVEAEKQNKNFEVSWIGPLPATEESAKGMNMSHPDVVKLFVDNPSLKSIKVVESCAPNNYETFNFDTKKQELSGFSDHFPISALIRKKK